ncbi:MAG: hypothetical protein C4524_14895 [Candidatus Zixiibacteriota bacterium]|nr:MAG: hypothetical protein C4524_14895 [candidate division Zixibacteria bacterium]
MKRFRPLLPWLACLLVASLTLAATHEAALDLLRPAHADHEAEAEAGPCHHGDEGSCACACHAPSEAPLPYLTFVSHPLIAYLSTTPAALCRSVVLDRPDRPPESPLA